jgi:hypothetical protein
MTLDTKTREQIELELETSHAQYAEGLLDPNVDDGTKLLAAAIALAGSEIALSIHADGEAAEAGEAA